VSVATDKAGLETVTRVAALLLLLLLQCVIKEYNPSVYNFNVSDVHCNYMFRLQLSNHHQAVYRQ
jgi:hypothetical protein